MSEQGKKWLLWGSAIIFLLSLGGILITSIIPYSRTIDKIQIIIALVLVLSILNVIVLISIRYHERKWLKLTSRVSLYALPVCTIVPYILSNYTNYLNSNLVETVFVVLIIILTPFALIYLFIIREASDLVGILILISLVIISVILQQIDIFLNIVEEFLLPIFVILTAAGMYMYGLRCLFILGKNIYLKVVAYIACTLIAFGGYAFLFKVLNGQAVILELVYFIPAFLLTLIVLLSLPISGYIHWNSLHKSILKKIMVSWMFFFIIFSVRFVFPDLFKVMTIKDNKPSYYFRMNEYELQNKNGLEPE